MNIVSLLIGNACYDKVVCLDILSFDIFCFLLLSLNVSRFIIKILRDHEKLCKEKQPWKAADDVRIYWNRRLFPQLANISIVLFKGRHQIQTMGGQLKMNSHCLDSAFMFYKMAVSKRFTSGRRTTYVIGACLYLVSRTEKTPRIFSVIFMNRIKHFWHFFIFIFLIF